MNHKPPQCILAILLSITAVANTAKKPRDPAQRAHFQQAHPCPSTGKRSGACPGYVVDHVRPLACGGVDHPSNMQWQTAEEAKRKDRTERAGCR